MKPTLMSLGNEAGAARAQRLSEAVFTIRRRRAVTSADMLLDECLALLDTVVEQSPTIRVFVPANTAGASTVRSGNEPVPEIDGRSPAIERLKKDIAAVARDGYVSVLIRGESGTGKERVARAIHQLSPRKHRPFVVVNCAGLTPTLAEDELFGHVRGAFTGAASDREGPFERANGGTVFLDEIGDLPAESQMKLLRALQARTVQRLGGTRETAFDAQIVAATHTDLESAQQSGRFRHDLYYRLKVYELRLPPLRSRGERDLRRLVEAILKGLTTRRKRTTPALAPEVWSAFLRYPWPGNVRELENTLERMVVAADGGSLLATAHMPDNVRAMIDPVCPPTIGLVSAPALVQLPEPSEALAALEHNGFRLGRTALQLGLSRHQLYRLLKRHAAAGACIDRALA
jgi:two-component system, NtrC family, response regulator HydG